MDGLKLEVLSTSPEILSSSEARAEGNSVTWDEAWRINWRGVNPKVRGD
jgi:hypothetical protein